MPRTTRTVVADTVAAPIGPYSHAVASGGLLFCTGQLPLRADGSVEPGDTAAQARRCLENLRAVCAAAGTTLSHAVRVGIYLVNLEDGPAVNAVYATFFPDDPPARTTIGVAALPMGVPVEIDAVVALTP